MAFLCGRVVARGGGTGSHFGVPKSFAGMGIGCSGGLADEGGIPGVLFIADSLMRI